MKSANEQVRGRGFIQRHGGSGEIKAWVDMEIIRYGASCELENTQFLIKNNLLTAGLTDLGHFSTLKGSSTFQLPFSFDYWSGVGKSSEGC